MEKVDLQKVQDELKAEISIELFGTSEGIIIINEVKRSTYTRAMEKVQNKYGLRQGHPQFLEWVFTCVGQSPIIIEDEEGAGEDGN